MSVNVKERGIRAENYFASLLNEKGIQYEFVNDWFDFIVNHNGSHKVEVKSCQLSIRDGRSILNKYRCGRFDFTNCTNRELQEKENVWIAFILHNDYQFMFLGFVRAKELEKKRYIPLYELRKMKPKSMMEWLMTVDYE